MRIYTKNRLRFFLLLCISFLLIFVCNLLTPYLSDDYFYSVAVRQAHSFSDLVKQEYEQYMTWNGRSVVHFLLRLMLLAPDILFRILNSAMFVLLSLLIYFNVDGRKSYDLRLLCGITLLLWFSGIEFSETVLWKTGACNYLWGSVIILGFVTLYRHLLSRGSWKHPARLAAGVFLFGLLAGWCNENSSGGGLLLTLGVLLFYLRGQPSRRILPWMPSGIAGQCLGLFLMVISPGSRHRAALSDSEVFDGAVGLFARFQKISLILQEHLFLWIAVFLFLLILSLMQGQKLSALRLPLLFFAVSLLTSYALVLTAPTQARAHFAAGVFLLVAIGQIYVCVREEETLLRTCKTAAVVIGAAWFFFFYLDNTTNLGRIYREAIERTDYLAEQAAEGNQDTVYVAALRPVFETPLSAAHKHDLTEDPDYWTNVAMEQYYGINTIIALPRETWEETVR